MISKKIKSIINFIRKELMRTNDKLHVDRVQIKRPKDSEKWARRFLEIILDSEFCPVLQIGRKEM